MLVGLSCSSSFSAQAFVPVDDCSDFLLDTSFSFSFRCDM